MNAKAPIDLRSDTMTRPTPAMRTAMLAAEVGDDVWGEDPTVCALQEEVAELLGKEAGLFVPSGTMANQIALLVHARRGDEVLGAWGSHCANYEGGAAAAIAGIQFVELGQGGLFGADQVAGALRSSDIHHPPSRLVWLENTHNRGGGLVFPLDQAQQIATLAHSMRSALHVDGARLLNAAVATGRPARELVSFADSASICLSKGLGAPAGSVLVGSTAFIAEALRWRKRLGGGMRQVGILAAAGLYALEYHVDRLAEDHANARTLAERLTNNELLSLDIATVQTNIVIFELAPEAPPVAEVLRRCGQAGVALCPFGERRLRAVTHLDVNRAECERAADVITTALSQA